MKQEAGFTLLEIMLVLAIITIVMAFSFPVFSSLTNSSDVQIAMNSTVSSLRRAQVNSRAVQSDSAWGVHIETGQLTLFAGDDFASRDESLDQTYELNQTVEISGDSEIVFEKFSGFPEVAGTITFTGQNNEDLNLEVTSTGNLDF